ncbi:zinc finger domain-containing protein [Trichoderma ceciliae]
MTCRMSNRKSLDAVVSGAEAASLATIPHLPPTLQLINFLETVPSADDVAADSSSAEPHRFETHPLGHLERQLRESLSLHLHDGTTVALAVSVQSDGQEQSDEPFRKIGAGACGAVFARDGEALAIKLAKRGNEDALRKDFRMHERIADQFDKWNFTAVKIPRCQFFAPRDEPTYLNQHPKLIEVADEVCYLPASALVSERIIPFGTPTRSSLIYKYCDSRLKEMALADDANRDCLVRVYLGSVQDKSDATFFSLRNFKMHLNQMAELQLDVEAMARRIAAAMAIMHWGAKTSARDVEFVLGCSLKNIPPENSPETSPELSGTESQRLPHPTDASPPLSAPHEEASSCLITDLWLLDFNQVDPIPMDEDGVQKAVEAARVNDPYFPKPLQASRIEKEAWNAFVSSYITASDVILEESGARELLALPRMFIRGLIESQRRKHQRLEQERLHLNRISRV